MHANLTDWRLAWYPRCVLFALFMGFVIVVFTGNGAETLTGRLGGDFPAFYGIGRLVAHDEGKSLYDPARQSQFQKDLFPEGDSGYLPFTYPPFVALAYAPLSLVNYRIAYVLHTFLLFAALALAIQFIRPANKFVDRHYVFSLALALTFYPMFRAVFSSLNTSVSLLLIVCAWRAVSSDREWLAGVMLGLLLFKPQFAVPLIGLHVLQCRWRVGLGSLLTAGILYAVSAWVSGLFWITDWMKHTWWHYQIDTTLSYANSVSWLGFLEAVIGPGHLSTLAIGWSMNFLTAAGVAGIWIKGGRRMNPALLFAAAMPTLVLMPPHVMYYDMGLLLFTYVVFLEEDTLKNKGLFVGSVWLFSFSQIGGSNLGFSPIFFLLIFTGGSVLYFLKANFDKQRIGT
jgi:hypothetical protein